MAHVGISVASLERSIEFYQTGFGMEVVAQSRFELGTEDGRYEAILDLPGASGRVALLKAGDLALELFEFSYPPPLQSSPRRPVCDHGISHFCVEVSDIEQEYLRLLRSGARFHCPPLRFFGNAVATYGRDPDGNVFELVELTARAGSATSS